MRTLVDTLRLLVMVGLIAAAAGCSHEPSEETLHSWAHSAEAEPARVTAEQRIRDRIARFAAVGGLAPVATRFVDACHRRPSRSAFDADRPTYELRCAMTAVAVFGAQGQISHVLRKIRAARITSWGDASDNPTVSGTVAYALTYLRRDGRYPDGRRMPTPQLRSDVTAVPSMVVDWDRSSAERPTLLTDPSPCPPRDVYLRCESAPDPLPDLPEARRRYHTILRVELGGGSGNGAYFEVPRG